MPTTRKRRNHARKAGVQPYQLHVLKTGRVPAGVEINRFEMLDLEPPCPHYLAPLWQEVGGAVTAAWIRVHPGTRPFAWWLFDSPRDGDGKPIPREQVGGSGRPHELIPQRFGIPDRWVSESDLILFPEYRRDMPVHDDPPVFEAEATYLQRHNLLTPGERRKSDFTPVSLTLPAECLRKKNVISMRTAKRASLHAR